jgi:hypothetical protein
VKTFFAFLIGSALGMVLMFCSFIREVPREDLNKLAQVYVPSDVRVFILPITGLPYAGITFGKFVTVLDSVSSIKEKECTIAHEMIHVRQYQELGYLKFFYYYGKDFLHNYETKKWRDAYLSIYLEVEATKTEDSCH